MIKSRGRRLVACGSLAAGLLAATLNTALGQSPGRSDPEYVSQDAPPQGPALSLDQLARMGWPELERLYRQSDAGTVPLGYAAGKAIYCPCERLAGVRSRLTGVVWRGKVFDACGGLVNQWCGFRAVRRGCTTDRAGWTAPRPSSWTTAGPPGFGPTSATRCVRWPPACTSAGCTASRRASRSFRCSSPCGPARVERPRAPTWTGRAVPRPARQSAPSSISPSWPLPPFRAAARFPRRLATRQRSPLAILVASCIFVRGRRMKLQVGS